MALQNASYDKIQEEYLQIRRENDRLYEERLSSIYTSHPELKEYDDRIADLLLKKAFCALNAPDAGDSGESAVEEEIVRTRAEREAAAKAAGREPAGQQHRAGADLRRQPRLYRARGRPRRKMWMLQKERVRDTPEGIGNGRNAGK